MQFFLYDIADTITVMHAAHKDVAKRQKGSASEVRLTVVQRAPPVFGDVIIDNGLVVDPAQGPAKLSLQPGSDRLLFVVCSSPTAQGGKKGRSVP